MNTESLTTSQKLIGWVLSQRVLVLLGAVVLIGWGALVAPFDFDTPIERDPVPVDAIPDIGENQQIVFTQWAGRSPEDIDDQVTYPLTVALLGMPEVKTIRSYSSFGFSTIYVIFEEDAEFYWARSRVVEKLASLPINTLPQGVSPQLGPDATGLGQVFWYTLEGRNGSGTPAGGWDLHEIRSVQDYQVRYALAAADGVSEVASIGGFVQEYQVDVDPESMQAFGVTLQQIYGAVRDANAEVGARSTEISGVEYLIRGVGFLEDAQQLRDTVVGVVENVPVRVSDVARVSLGPSQRRGALDRGGAEAVGGVVVARYGANPMEVIRNVEQAIDDLAPSLPSRTLADGTVSQLTVVPFYNRATLIDSTIDTLETALTQQILITLLVVMVMMLHLRSSLLISSLLPLAVLATFVAMRQTNVTANVVSLAGIAIAIGTMVDIAIVITENIVRRLDEATASSDRLALIRDATAEVAPAVLTAVATTVVSFFPVFMLEGAEGKLFGPLALTKTYAICASVVVALTVIPPVAWLLIGRPRPESRALRFALDLALIALGIAVAVWLHGLLGTLLIAFAAARLIDARDPAFERRHAATLVSIVANLLAVTFVCVALSDSWLPLGATAGGRNLVFVLLVVGGLLGGFWLFQLSYQRLLGWVLEHKLLFLSLPAMLVAFGLSAWLGFGTVFSWLPTAAHASRLGVAAHHALPGLGVEFMPQLDEGAFLYMPSTMPHASIGEALEVTRQLDMLIETIPEVEFAVGKLGRAETALDPAPVSMIETIIQYQSEYVLDDHGRHARFAVGEDGEYLRDDDGGLVHDDDGVPFRNWRPEIRTQADVWDEIVRVARVPGLTAAPLLQPISTRILMLQSGIRAPMAVRLRGPDLDSLAEAAASVEHLLRTHPSVDSNTVNADRPVGKPYLEIHPDRVSLSRHGVTMAQVQDVIEIAIGGRTVTHTVEGRERYPVRVRYPRELRDTPARMANITVTSANGTQIPLGELAELRYVQGAQMIRSEDGLLVNYVMFDASQGLSEVEVVEAVEATMLANLEDRSLQLPDGVSFDFAGSYENSIRASKRLAVIVPVVLLTIFVLLYLQFRSALTAFMVFAGVAVAMSGGFVMMWCFAQPGFLDIGVLGQSMRDVFQIAPVHLSVAVWVGFIALFGIATDDGVVMATYLRQSFGGPPPDSLEAVRARVIEAGARRVRPCLMTTATTLLALLPILTSYGTGADVMTPMAVPILGGMTIELLTLFIVPLLYSAVEETKFRFQHRSATSPQSAQ